MRWLPWVRRRETNGHEARMAVAESTRKLEETSQMQARVKSITDRLAGSEDLFRIKIEQAFKGHQ